MCGRLLMAVTMRPDWGKWTAECSATGGHPKGRARYVVRGDRDQDADGGRRAAPVPLSRESKPEGEIGR